MSETTAGLLQVALLIAALAVCYRPLGAYMARTYTSEHDTGVGLGLAVARGLTEAMDGRLSAEDTPGGGLTMVIDLPIATPPADPRPVGAGSGS